MLAFAITEASQTMEARRESVRLAKSVGLSEEDQGRVAIAATELCTNMIKHASGGEFLVGLSAATQAACVEIVALDRGPGMRDIDACLADGYSTAGTQGTGLGAIRRQATTFDAFTGTGSGTAIHLRICQSGIDYVPSGHTKWAVIERPVSGEKVSGDGFAVREARGHFVALLCDGLGHGAFAAQAASEAVRIFSEAASTDAEALAESIHLGLRPTRGAAIAVADVEQNSRRVTYCGIGNIGSAVVTNGSAKRMVSNNGTAGHVAPRVRAFQYPCGSDCLLVMHSDGIASNWSLDKFPGLAHREPGLIAAVLYREFARARDDAAVLVARISS